MLYVPFYKGGVASLKSLPCNEFIDLERPERIFDHLVWFPINTCSNIFSLTKISFLLVKVQSGIPSATKDGAGLSFLLLGLLGIYLPTTEQGDGGQLPPCVQMLVLLRGRISEIVCCGCSRLSGKTYACIFHQQ